MGEKRKIYAVGIHILSGCLNPNQFCKRAMKIQCNFNEKKRVKKSIKVEENDDSLPQSIVYKLCLNRILSSWGDRTWEFATGLLLIKLYPESLLLAAVQGILNSVAVIIFSPVIGRWIEKSPRLREAKITLFIQNGAVIFSALFASLYFKRDAIANDALREIISQGAPIAFVLFSVVGQVFSCGYTLMLEKDWLLAIASNHDDLTHLNALLRQIDLSCQTIAPFLVGFLTQYSEFATASFLCCWNAFSTTAEYLILRNIYYTGPESIRAEKRVSHEHELRVFDVLAIKEYCSEFLLPGLSFALVYLTVLGFDSVTIGFLVTHSVSDSLVGVVSLIAGIFGIFGTRLFKELVSKIGLNYTGQLGFILKLACVAPCLTMVYYSRTIDIYGIDLTIMLFLCGLVLSRMGLWLTDLAVNQLIQTKTRKPSVIGGVQSSLNIFMELLKFSLVAVLSDLSQFWILVVISYLSIIFGTVLFSVFVRKDTSEKNETNNFENTS